MTSTHFLAVGDAGLGPSASAGLAGGGLGGDVGVGGTGMLALTGAGPGTLVLALTGLASIVAGAAAVLTGRHLRTTSDPSSPLSDLAHRSVELA